MNKRDARLRRARRTRAHIRRMGDTPMLTVHRTPKHIYAQVIIFEEGQVKVLASASTNDKETRDKLDGSKSDKAVAVGKKLAEGMKKAGVERVAFDRSGFKYHGRIKALADAVRENGINF